MRKVLYKLRWLIVIVLAVIMGLLINGLCQLDRIDNPKPSVITDPDDPRWYKSMPEIKKELEDKSKKFDI